MQLQTKSIIMVSISHNFIYKIRFHKHLKFNQDSLINNLSMHESTAQCNRILLTHYIVAGLSAVRADFGAIASL